MNIKKIYLLSDEYWIASVIQPIVQALDNENKCMRTSVLYQYGRI